MTLIQDFLPIFQGGSWEALTTPGSEKYHHLWAPLLIFEMTGYILFLIFSIVLLFLFFMKAYKFPMLFIIFLALNLIYSVTDFFISDLIPTIAAESPPDDVLKFFASLTGVIIWIPYFLVSKRVKNTFVKPESPMLHPSTQMTP